MESLGPVVGALLLHACVKAAAAAGKCGSFASARSVEVNSRLTCQTIAVTLPTSQLICTCMPAHASRVLMTLVSLR
jgi:hypothetical protein